MKARVIDGPDSVAVAFGPLDADTPVLLELTEDEMSLLTQGLFLLEDALSRRAGGGKNLAACEALRGRFRRELDRYLPPDPDNAD